MMPRIRKSRRLSGLYAVTPETSDGGWLGARVEAALAGGARIVQYRSKSNDPQVRREQCAPLVERCRAYGALLIVNDDVGLARELNADGVHLGREDMPPAAARAELGPGILIGVSCYDSLPRALEAQHQGADYVAFGSFFPSPVKPHAARAPLVLLRAARSVLGLPIVAIGGITPDNARALVEAGADALAVISSLFHAPDTLAAARTFAGLFATEYEPPSIHSDR
jgi:thiamine-phosphate pyrophosphorylase